MLKSSLGVLHGVVSCCGAGEVPRGLNESGECVPLVVVDPLLLSRHCSPLLAPIPPHMTLPACIQPQVLAGTCCSPSARPSHGHVLAHFAPSTWEQTVAFPPPSGIFGNLCFPARQTLLSCSSASVRNALLGLVFSRAVRTRRAHPSEAEALSFAGLACSSGLSSRALPSPSYSPCSSLYNPFTKIAAPLLAPRRGEGDTHICLRTCSRRTAVDGRS